MDHLMPEQEGPTAASSDLGDASQCKNRALCRWMIPLVLVLGAVVFFFACSPQANKINVKRVMMKFVYFKEKNSPDELFKNPDVDDLAPICHGLLYHFTFKYKETVADAPFPVRGNHWNSLGLRPEMLRSLMAEKFRNMIHNAPDDRLGVILSHGSECLKKYKLVNFDPDGKLDLYSVNGDTIEATPITVRDLGGKTAEGFLWVDMVEKMDTVDLWR